MKINKETRRKLVEHLRNIEINAACNYADNPSMHPEHRRMLLQYRDAGRAGLRMLGESSAAPWSTDAYENTA